MSSVNINSTGFYLTAQDFIDFTHEMQQNITQLQKYISIFTIEDRAVP
jgi:hypothetical protein